MKTSVLNPKTLPGDLEPVPSEATEREEIIELPENFQEFSDDQRIAFIRENWGKKINHHED